MIPLVKGCSTEAGIAATARELKRRNPRIQVLFYLNAFINWPGYAAHATYRPEWTLRDAAGKKYLDLISGISVSSLGHRHPVIVDAINEQLKKYMHLMVYGEYIQSPQVKLAEFLVSLLPEKLNCVYFTNSGSEATEGAMKLAKRATGRTQIISFKKNIMRSVQFVQFQRYD